MTTMHPVIAALKAERKRRGWSQATVAREIGYATATISVCECGHRSPGLALLVAWAAALDRQIVAAPVMWDEQP